MTTQEDIRTQNLARAEKLEEASVNAANDGLKALLLLNGGACIALMSFLATSLSNQNMQPSQLLLLTAVTKSLVFFAGGAGLAVFTSFFAYLSNQSYSSHLRNPIDYPRSWTVGHIYLRLGIITALASTVGFAAGVYKIWATAL